jgi:hypothetical protein
MERVGFVLNGIAWTGAYRFLPNWNGLEWKKSVLARLERLGMEEVGFGLSRMAWNEGSQFWPDWNSLEWRKMVAEVDFGLTRLVSPTLS